MAVVANQNLSVISTNASNNTAVVEYKVTAKTSGESWQGYTQEGTFYIDGVKYTSSYTLPENTTTTVFSKRVTISNASGKKVSASYSFYTTPSYGTLTGNTSVNIPVLLKTPQITSLALKDRSLDSLTFKYDLNESANKIYYKLSNQSEYIQIASNNKSGEFTINSLNPNTSYTINFKARNTSGNTNKDADLDVTGTTFQIAKINTINDFKHGDNVNLNITNPSNSPTSLKVSIDTTEILNQNLVSGNNTIQFNDSQLDSIYKKYNNNNSVSITFKVITNNNSNYTDKKSIVCTLKGNQKTIKTNINGIWKRGKIWTNINGIWKQGVVWANINGTWRRGI